MMIELDLMQSTWAYNVRAAILMDLYLLHLLIPAHSPIWLERRSRRTADIGARTMPAGTSVSNVRASWT
ncbi:hypothetical protein CVM73_20205 [Bradyrhizobium forestalis]|uniref:Uncharacterized protein n=1 Tax=Bradyrhizobium forestalis TaxID=1419263 RepID=A0A2M8R6P0_9BRAD|nr:hypothetical protein CVM73_20205 [Bradyrhizobium forestalis]